MRYLSRAAVLHQEVKSSRKKEIKAVIECKEQSPLYMNPIFWFLSCLQFFCVLFHKFYDMALLMVISVIEYSAYYKKSGI